jgi:hypothetical protein
MGVADGINSVEHNTSVGGDIVGPTITGHNAASKAGTIGAVPFSNGATVEDYSSTGPARYCWQPVPSTTAIPGCTLTKGVDVAATDGSANSFFGQNFGGVFRFFGTSAAAPHAAAVAALQTQARPCRTPAEIIAAQKAGAVAIADPAATGSGRLDAVGAINQLAPCPATHLKVTAPADATTNVSSFFTVQALDAQNHVSISYTGTVHFTSSDGTAVLPANATLTNGQGTFQATFKTVGNQTLTAADTAPGPTSGSATIAVANPFGYHPITPVRVLDSRPGPESKQYATKWGGGTDRPVTVTGTITGNAVPSTAKAVVLNVTAVNPSAASNLTVYPSGQSRPNASNLNFTAGEVIPNLVVARIGTGGQIQIFNNSGNVDVIADVAGWFDDGSAGGDLYHPLAPNRILETRFGFGPQLQYTSPWGGGTDRPVTVRGGSTTVPNNATAVVLNVTAVNPSTGSDLRIYPSGQTRPNASSLNFVQGQVAANLVIAQVGTGGQIQIFNNSGNVDVIADVVGYFTPAASGGGPYHPLTPSRLLETRPGFGPIQYSQFWGPGADRSVQITGTTVPGNVPPNATAVVLNVTAVNPNTGSNLTVYPSGQSRPNASNLNFVGGQTVPNLVIVGIGTGGKIQIYNNNGYVDIIADVVGYFT